MFMSVFLHIHVSDYYRHSAFCLHFTFIVWMFMSFFFLLFFLTLIYMTVTDILHFAVCIHLMTSYILTKHWRIQVLKLVFFPLWKQTRNFVWSKKQKQKMYSCIVPLGFLPWEVQVALPGESQLWQSHATQPTVHTGCFSVSIIHQTLTWTPVCLTCAQTLMHAVARGCVWTL